VTKYVFITSSMSPCPNVYSLQVACHRDQMFIDYQ